MFRYKLRTLLILLAILPPIVATIAPPLIQWFKQKPPPSPATVANPNSPYSASYATVPADPQFTLDATRTLMTGTPVQIQLDSKTNKLVVWGTPSAHRTVQAIIGEMQRQPAPIVTTKSPARTQPPAP